MLSVITKKCCSLNYKNVFLSRVFCFLNQLRNNLTQQYLYNTYYFKYKNKKILKKSWH